jgi:hypothetical protein
MLDRAIVIGAAAEPSPRSGVWLVTWMPVEMFDGTFFSSVQSTGLVGALTVPAARS